MKLSTPRSALSLTCALLAAAALNNSGLASAQSVGQSEAIEEIVVTATKSGEQKLQSVPLAIQAFSGDSLKEKNIGDVNDLMSSIPGAALGQDNNVATRSYTIRGVGAASSTNGDSPIGYYLDDVPFNVPNFGIAPPIRFLDIDRVEVLRGPQGTLYGQGSAGGTMIFHTKDPDLHQLRISAESTVSKTDGASGINYGEAGALSIPLVDNVLALRLSGGYSKNSGYADVFYGAPNGAPNEKKANYSDNVDMRAVILWAPASNIRIRGQYWEFRPNQNYDNLLTSVNPPYFANTGGVHGYSTGEFKLYSLSTEFDFSGAEVTNVISDLVGTFGNLLPLGGGGSFSSFFFPKNFSDELRVHSAGTGPLHWLAGAQFQNGEGPQKNLLLFPAFNLSQNADNSTETKNWATFGEISYDLYDGKLVPLVGLREYHDKRTYIEVTTSEPSTKNVTTWRVNLSYLPNDKLTTFVTAATGFRSGIVQSSLQANALLADGVPSSTSLDPEKLKNYEAGLKWRSAENTLSIGANLYRIELTGVQTGLTSSIGVGGYTNLGNAHSDGLDLEVHWRTPLSGLTLGAIGNINDGQFDEVAAAVQKALPYVHPGARLTNAVRNNAQLNASYDRELTSNLGFFSDVSWNHYGNRVMSSGDLVSSFALVNFSAGIRRGPWEIAVTGENLANERGPTDIFSPTFQAGPMPRTIGMRVRANF
jgi:iron complex outermembrane receptor protein